MQNKNGFIDLLEGIAAKNLNREFIGIELDENYFEIAKSRILGNVE